MTARLVALACALTLLAGSYWYVFNAGKRVERGEWVAAQAKAERAARAWEQKLSQDAANFAQEKQDEINRIDDQLRAANERLRQRPERPAAGLPTPSAACAGQTGESLAGGDARFLAGYAADAAKIAAALNQCEKQYNAARNVD